MNSDDFRYMRRGKQLSGLTAEELSLLNPVNQRGKGTTRALLILHGFSSSPAVYRHLIPKIKNYDAIICPALPGHAQSIDVFSHVKSAEWFLAAQTLCEQLLKEYPKVDVLGLSLGGLLACKLSEQLPINHLFLLAPALKLHLKTNSMIQLARACKLIGFSHLRNAAGNLLNNDDAEIAYRKLPISTIIEVLELIQNYRWVPPSCPVDLFLGAHDLVVASAEIEQLFAPLAHATIHWLKNSAHVLPLDNDADEIIQCINKISLSTGAK
jgi:carboxylesterase